MARRGDKLPRAGRHPYNSSPRVRREMKNQNQRPIGIFDSGVGGLTVVKEIADALPNEGIVYFGDSLRAPYGNRSDDELVAFSKQIITFLLDQNIKALVVACGTISTRIFSQISQMLPKDIPVFEVATLGAKAAAVTTKNNNIGVIATEGTVKSSTFDKLITSQNKKANVYSQACPAFVPLVEEGNIHTEQAFATIKEVLNVFEGKAIDTLVLGCTHYPLLSHHISNVMGSGVRLINLGTPLAVGIKAYLEGNNMANNTKTPIMDFYVSGDHTRFKKALDDIMGIDDLKVTKNS